MSDNIHILRPALVLEVDAEMARLGLSQNRAAKRIGVHASAFSAWRNGTYKGDNPAIEAKVRNWLNTEEEMEKHSLGAARLDAHLALHVTSEFSSLLAYAQAEGDIVLIQGISGTGKTWAARRYCETHSAAHYVPMTGAMRSMAGVMGRVSEAAGGYRKHGSALEAEDDAIQRLRDRSALLIVDEAHHLTPRLIDELRCISDHAGCGLALMGDETIEMRLARCPQVVGRIGGEAHKGAPAEADVELLVSAFLERPASRKEVAMGMTAALGAGGLHALRRMLVKAWRLARIEDRDAVSTADLEAVAPGVAAARVQAPEPAAKAASA